MIGIEVHLSRLLPVRLFANGGIRAFNTGLPAMVARRFEIDERYIGVEETRKEPIVNVDDISFVIWYTYEDDYGKGRLFCPLRNAQENLISDINTAFEQWWIRTGQSILPCSHTVIILHKQGMSKSFGH